MSVADEEILNVAARLRALEWWVLGGQCVPRDAREFAAFEEVSARGRQRSRELNALMVAVKAVVNAQYAAAKAAGRDYP